MMNSKKTRNVIIILFAVYLIIGLFCFNDYGCGPDEGMERQTSLVNYRYMIEKLNIPISEANKTWLAYLPELKEYRDRYYGTALHFPLVLIEAAVHFTLEPSQFYGMRHLYTFLNYYIAMICFYRLLSGRFGQKTGIFGTLMMILTPRFFAESYYNNKDILFTAWYIFGICVSLRWIRNKTIPNALLCGSVIALACNTRFNAIAFIPLLIAVFVYDLIFRKERSAKAILSLVILLLTCAAVFYLATPNFWEEPLKVFRETMEFNRRHPNHTADGNLFFGRTVDAAKTWYFVPVWIFLTTPLCNLIFSVCGVFTFCFVTIKKKIVPAFQDRNAMTDLFCFCIGFLPIAAIIKMHVFIYNSWRHCYFCYPVIIYFAAYGLHTLTAASRKREISFAAAVMVGISLIYNCGWILLNHPHEYAYFNPSVRKYSNLFSGDYWGICSRELVEAVSKDAPEQMVKVNHLYSPSGSINRGLLDKEVRQYFEMTYDEDKSVDYYIIVRDDKPSTDIGLKSYKELTAIIVDGDKIGAVYKRK